MVLLIPLRLVTGKKISEITKIRYCDFSHRLNPLELLMNQQISALVKIYLKHTIIPSPGIVFIDFSLVDKGGLKHS